MTRLSILTLWNADDAVHEDTLASVLQNRPERSEIIVVHRGDYDDPYDLSSEVRFLSASADASPLEMLNLGADEAEGDFLHILQAGVHATDGWADAALTHFCDAQVVSVTPLVLDDKQERIATAGIRLDRAGGRTDCGAGLPRMSTETARLRPLGPSLAAGFYRIEAWDTAWGLDINMGSAADADLALCLQPLGECRVAADSVMRRVARPTPDTPFQIGRAQQRLFLRHGAEQNISALANRLSHWAQLLGGCFAPAHWSAALGRWSAKFTPRESEQFAQRWEEVLDTAKEVALEKMDEPDFNSARKAA